MAHVSGHSSLIKTILHKSLAEGVYRDVTTRSSNYYYFLGKTLAWDNELDPPYPVDRHADNSGNSFFEPGRPGTGTPGRRA